MRVDPRRYGRERRRLLEPLALRLKLDYDREVVSPGWDRPHIALQLVGCGADLLSGLCYPDSVPTPHKKVGKSVAKALASRFATDDARHAAVYLAQAMALWFLEGMRREDPYSASVHQRLCDLIQQYFPLDPADLSHLDGLRAEYRVMQDHNTAGRHPATGWYMALADPEFAEGRDPDTDPELVESQLRYASRYLRLGAECKAIAICLGERHFGKVEGQLFFPYWPGWEILEYDIGDLRWWVHTAELWHAAGERLVASEAA